MSFAQVQFYENAGNGVEIARHGTDKNLLVEFYSVREMKTIAPVNPADPTLAGEVQAITDEKGNLVYNEIPYVRIYTPGSKTTVVERRAKLQGNQIEPSDPQRFPTQWDAYQKGEEQKLNGHPLADMGMGDKEVRTFNGYNIYTVEHLVNVPDSLLPDGILGVRSIREKAREWLDKQNNKQAALEEQNKKLADQDAKIAELQAQIEALTAAKSNKKGE